MFQIHDLKELMNQYTEFLIRIAFGYVKDLQTAEDIVQETDTIIKATTQTPNEELFLYLFIPGTELWDNPDFLKVMDQM